MSIQKNPQANTVYFVWLNQYSGILLKTPTVTLAIDPADIKPKSLPALDAILITHEHYDHLDQPLIAALQAATNCQVIADAASAQKLQLNIPPSKLRSVKPGDQVQVGAVTVKAQKCNHNAKAPVTYIVTSEDNLKIYHTADSLPFGELALLAQKEQFDVVFCSVGIAPGASPKSGFEIARLTKPPLAVPYHAGSERSLNEFAALIKRDLPKTACLVPQLNRIYQVSKGSEKE
ncbi:MAG: MBL fold metallo-hydrolase [Candidatus Bathyarchaeota archaeon]|nr:MBL fold metallo-hydrolase [Candidatus Bathyarchaeota archaeon]